VDNHGSSCFGVFLDGSGLMVTLLLQALFTHLTSGLLVHKTAIPTTLILYNGLE
jgi:hypothetical protein